MATDAKVEPDIDLRAWAATRAREIRRQYGQPTELSPALSEPLTPEEREARVQRFRRMLEKLDQMGTEEERRETCEILMKTLAETRREEGRVF